MTDRGVFALAAVAIVAIAGLVALVLAGHAEAAGLGLWAVLMIGYLIFG